MGRAKKKPGKCRQMKKWRKKRKKNFNLKWVKWKGKEVSESEREKIIIRFPSGTFCCCCYSLHFTHDDEMMLKKEGERKKRNRVADSWKCNKLLQAFAFFLSATPLVLPSCDSMKAHNFTVCKSNHKSKKKYIYIILPLLLLFFPWCICNKWLSRIFFLSFFIFTTPFTHLFWWLFIKNEKWLI